jgi:hypothetical protein
LQSKLNLHKRILRRFVGFFCKEGRYYAHKKDT